MSIANKYHVFRLHEFAATLTLAAAACWAVYPENRLTDLVISEKNSPVSVKYLESIVRINPGDSRYRLLLADRYIGTGQHERAMAQLLAATVQDTETLFSRDVRTLALYREAPQYMKSGKEASIISARTLSAILSENSRQRLGAQYAETAALGIWPAALAAAERILPFETWNRYYWLIKAAEASEHCAMPQKAASYYISAAKTAPDQERRRQVFRKALLTLSAAGLQRDIKKTLYACAKDFASDKVTAATMLSFSRQTGDPYFARDIALQILRMNR